MSVLWLSWRNLMRHRMRAVLMFVAVAVAFTLYGTLFGFTGLLSGSDVAGSRDLIVHHRAGILQPLPISYGQTIARTRGIDSVAAVAIIGGYAGEQANKVPTLMVDAEPYLAQNADGIVLPDDQRAAFIATRDAVIVDERTAAERGWSVGDTVVISSEIAIRTDGSFDWPFRVAGIFTAEKPEEGMSGAIAHLGYYNDAAAFGRDRVHWFAVQSRDPALNADISAQIDSGFANSEAETRTEPAAAMASAFLSQVVDFTLVIRVVVASAFVTILMVIGNTLALHVRQRQREFGVFRALGFGVPAVGAMVLGEAMFIALGGALIGLGLSTGLLALMTAAITGGAPSLASMPVGVLAGGLAIALTFAVLTGLLPALRASRCQPAEAFSRS